VAHPFEVFTKAGFAVEFASPKGGVAPVDPASVEAFAKDEVCTAFLANEEASAALRSTKAIADVDAAEYAAVCVAGGHGPMWDLPSNEAHNSFVAKAYEGGAVVSGESEPPAGGLRVVAPWARAHRADEDTSPLPSQRFSQRCATARSGS